MGINVTHTVRQPPRKLSRRRCTLLVCCLRVLFLVTILPSVVLRVLMFVMRMVETRKNVDECM